MLTSQELAKIERYMREEHRKDLEALERLKRFLPEESGPAENLEKESGDAAAEVSSELTEFMYQREL